MRNDYCVFILTHNRPNNVITYSTLRSHGYTGKIFIVVDDKDESIDDYKRLFGGDVLVFSIDEVSKYTDQMDNFTSKNSVLWKRNACWDLAKHTLYSLMMITIHGIIVDSEKVIGLAIMQQTY